MHPHLRLDDHLAMVSTKFRLSLHGPVTKETAQLVHLRRAAALKDRLQSTTVDMSWRPPRHGIGSSNAEVCNHAGANGAKMMGCVLATGARLLLWCTR